MNISTQNNQVHYLKRSGYEYLWKVTVDQSDSLIAGSFLGHEILRLRCIRDVSTSEDRYQLADGGEGTLPYHSWMVAHGDEQWSTTLSEAEMLKRLEPYLQTILFTPTQIQLHLSLEEQARIYGFGERTGGLNKRGEAFPIWNIDFPGHHDEGVTSMYTSIPFFTLHHVATGQASGVFIDYTGQINADLGVSEPGIATLTAEANELPIYFFTGPTPADVLRQYTELTGRMPLPARWTLGYHQCRWSYASAELASSIADQLRERKHPADAIWLDIDYMDGYRNFTWHPERFPDPVALTKKLHEQHFHVVTILDPGTKVDEEYSIYREGLANDYFCRYPNGELFVGSVWPGNSAFPDFSQAAVRAWWGKNYKALLDAGVDAIWNDMDEPALTNSLLNTDEDEPSLWGKTMDASVVHQAGGAHATGPDGPTVSHRDFHNAYGMELARTTYEGLRSLRPDSRPFVLTRSGTGGMQRYAALWTGDNTSKWSHIRLAVRMCLSIGVSGQAFVGSDIGGFHDDSNGELLTRFSQLGALMPFSRNHSSKETVSQEPWAFGEPYESAIRKAIETRYQLLPHLYTLFQQATIDGSPIMRPLYYHYPQDEQAANVETQFLIGETLLSAPISEAGATSREVYLPEGEWFDYWDGTPYSGLATHEVPAPLERWPFFVRANSIIPTGPVLQYTDQPHQEPLTFTCYLTKDGLASYTLYEDDGQTQAYRQGAFATTTLSCQTTGETVTVQLEEQHKGYKPSYAFYTIIVHIGDRTLQGQIQTGQGATTIKLS
ncbi:glycoside hydrolase family 31 protein [Tengunoibacter tsumagoiensis]|uniref:Alpha-glucosidase n=1 Tax=Tengunoibacter tsumagoiensis TaxID=2014871 RepID=A0A402A1R4_9CHLR|nr:TIM-barrel domain-containing protein [Tengunoibacter tsumagoiensis]GCE12989.1 alpha-glucosidase [Tengunoibacter tsumagoiensis]